MIIFFNSEGGKYKLFCTNCGKQQPAQARFCSGCGNQLVTELQTDELAQTVENIESGQENDPTFEEDLMLFVDQNSNYYKRKWENMDPKKNGFSFNAGAFFLTFFWLGYRKMYKLVFFISLGFLAIDAILYVVGYQYQLDSFIDPVDRAIGTATSALLGFYGNMLYKKHAEKKVLEIRDTISNPIDRETKLKKQGGRAFRGVLISALIFVFVYMVPTYFIPVNLDKIDTVKYTEFYDYPGVTLGELFDSAFVDGKWKHSESTSDYDMISFDGKKHVDHDVYDVSIVFIDEGLDEVEVLYVVIDGEELDTYDSNNFLDYIIDEHENQ